MTDLQEEADWTLWDSIGDYYTKVLVVLFLVVFFVVLGLSAGWRVWG